MDTLTNTPSAAPTSSWWLDAKQYLVALLVSAGPFLTLSLYIYFRRGYYDLYIANKALAGTALIMLGLVLLLGPLSRSFISFANHLKYRKEFGIIAFFFTLLHGVISLFFLPEKFPLEGFVGSWNWPFIFGLAATLLLIALFLISFETIIRHMNRMVWWKFQYWGVRLVFLLTGLHVFVLKYESWIAWYREGGSEDLIHPGWPGAGLLLAWFFLYVILVRFGEWGGRTLTRILSISGLLALVAVYIFTFWRGTQF